MKKTMLLICVLGLLTGCNDNQTTKINCSGFDIEMKFTDDGAKMFANIDGEDIEFTLVPSASGAKYDAQFPEGKLTLWSKGNEWQMFVNDGASLGCE